MAALNRSSENLDSPSFRMVVIEDDLMLSDLLARALRRSFAALDLEMFSTGREGIRRCLDQPPDMLVVDLGLPDMNGRQVVRTLRERLPDLRVIVLTGEMSPTLPAELLGLGASGFVDKMSGFAEMESAVQRVLANGLYFSVGMAPSSVGKRGPRPAPAGPPPATLSEREREIARLVASGLISKEIAAQLDLSPRTIEKARAQILSKLGFRDLPALVRWCVEHELI